MAQYEADKLLRLLQFCCWKARCEMDSKGFQTLSEKIDSIAEHSQSTPNDRYFIDLHSELNSAVKKDNLIGKKPEFIDRMLTFASFNTWKDWETALYNACEFVDENELDLASFSEMEIAVCMPTILEKQLFPDLSFVKRTAAYPLQLLSCKEESVAMQLQFVFERLSEFPFIIWAIPVGWKEQLPLLKNPSWEEVVQSKRVVPVWIDESSVWETQPSFIPWLKHHQTISGLSGLLSSVLFVQEVVKKYHRPNEAAGNSSKPSTGRVQNFQNSRGTFLLGDIQINSENTAMGDIHQTIHNHNNKKS